MLRADGTDGRYSLYRRSSRVWYRTDVRPPHPGEAILVTLEYQRKRSWQLGGRAWFVQDSSGVSLIYFAKASLPLGNYRLSSKMPQDAYHAPGTSAWAYFRVIR